MRISTALLASFLAFLLLTACSDTKPQEDADPFDTLQLCYDEHNGTEHLTSQQAIVTCCLDHPIGGMAAPTCLNTQADCVTHVRTALAPAILDADISAACMTYISMK
ncbi:MAG TPA: hypothetical protein VHT91_22505 [Kofleriaceae bacterium]|jgi:hypothetical protein|nr:hypothetical protein [Kofleriaceae bacterium]